MVDVFAVSAEPLPGGICIFDGYRKSFAGKRGAQRCALPGLRQEWKVYLSGGQHGFRNVGGVAGPYQLPASSFAQYLCGGIEEGRTVAGGSRKRRRKNCGCKIRREIEGRNERYRQGQRSRQKRRQER